MIVRVSVVLNWTDVDSDWRFDNLCGSHLQGHFDLEDGYRTCTSEMTPGFKPLTEIKVLFTYFSSFGSQ